jgi:hypothetical protein
LSLKAPNNGKPPNRDAVFNPSREIWRGTREQIAGSTQKKPLIAFFESWMQKFYELADFGSHLENRDRELSTNRGHSD